MFSERISQFVESTSKRIYWTEWSGYSLCHFSSLSIFLWMAFCSSGVSITPLDLVPSANLLRVHSAIPSAMSLMKILNNAGPSTDPWGSVPHLSPITIRTLSPCHGMPWSNKFLIHWTSPSIKPISPQFREKDVMDDHVKSLTEVQTDDLCSKQGAADDWSQK